MAPPSWAIPTDSGFAAEGMRRFARNARQLSRSLAGSAAADEPDRYVYILKTTMS